MWPWDAGWMRMPGEGNAGPPRKSLEAHKKPLMWPWDACWLRMPGERHAGPPRKSLDAHKKPLMWPWDACWLPALDAHKKRFRGSEGFKGLEGLKVLGAGKLQAWTPIRSHWCGLGMPVGCLRWTPISAHKKPLMWPWDAGWLRTLANGTLDRPRKSLDAHKKPLMWPWDACWLRMPGERHAAPPRRRDGSGLRVAILPALDAHEKPLMWPWNACCHWCGLGMVLGVWRVLWVWRVLRVWRVWGVLGV